MGLPVAHLESEPAPCKLVSSFLARQFVLILAGALFLFYTYVRRKLGLEKRSFKTFAADALKVGAQMVLGGVLLALMGVWLGRKGLDPLSWYGAEYPFEVCMSTYFTYLTRAWTHRYFVARYERTKDAEAKEWLKPFVNFGRYGEEPGQFRRDWFYWQLFHAVVLINLPARLMSLGILNLSLWHLPARYSPVLRLAQLWYA